MASVSIRQSSLMQVTRHARSAPNSNIRWWSALSNWDGEVQRVEIIDEGLGKSGADAFARGGFQYLLAEISLARAGLVLSYDASRLARHYRDGYQVRAVRSMFGCVLA